ncbi:hypothetical protein DUI87_01690 [Hirundo rustica rustica]|uniref:Integrase n=1 Tax=Hirundo rustica rustica TaxID=333673 RepID=A0A3M0LP01_HIRRU|nr:hypothetical protein DUI87_01690 [Hirundo rustica rustica]
MESFASRNVEFANVMPMVAPEKAQQQPPWKYLGVKILERTIRHQEVQFVQSVKTLNDAQKLVGVITWLRPYLGLTTAQLSPLFELLKGDTDLKSPRELTPEARKVLEEVQQAILACQVYCIEPSIDVTVFITTPDLHPTGIIGQWNDDWTDPLHVLEWVFLPHQPHKTATALFELIARLIINQEPVQGPTVFTDGSGKTGKAIVTWQDGSEWQVLEGHEDGSAQLVELKAAVMAFEKFSQEPFNLITDSAYVADIAQRLGCSVLKEVSNPALFDLLKALWCAIQARVHPYYVLHVRSHTNLPGFVAEGEKARDVIAHWRQAFAVLGIPSAVKTDNGPAYASQQASDGEQQPRAKVRVQNLVTKQWEGPYDLIAMGRGYACVSTDTGTSWLPSKCVRPDLRTQRQNSADRQGGSHDQIESHQVDESSSDHSDDSSTNSD